MQARFQRLPRRLLLIRHGESEANVNHVVYSTKPDWRIQLTRAGHRQAFHCGQELRRIVGDEKLYLYYSPYLRTRQTLEEIRKSLSPEQVLGECEDERLREQEIGNYQPIEKMDANWRERNDYGRLYYRFPCGESGADVGDRVSCFFKSLLRMNIELTVPEKRAFPGMDPGRGTNDGEGEGLVPAPFLDDLGAASDGGGMPDTSMSGYTAGNQNVVVVSHGLLIRLFVSRWFNMPVELTETLNNPPNCSIVVLEREDDSDRLVMTDASKALLGNDPRLQLMKFDGQGMMEVYQRKFLSSIDSQRGAKPQGVQENDDMGHYF